MGVKMTGINNAIETITDAPYQTALKVMLSIDTALVFITPRDTGRLANNWIPSFNKESNASFPFNDSEQRPADLSPKAVYPVRNPRNSRGNTLYLTNNLVYAEVRNEKGGKDGAPAPRWVETTVATQIKKVLRSLG